MCDAAGGLCILKMKDTLGQCISSLEWEKDPTALLLTLELMASRTLASLAENSCTVEAMLTFPISLKLLPC